MMASMQLSLFAVFVGVLVMSRIGPSHAHRREQFHFRRPACEPCDPESELSDVCDCRETEIIRVPKNPGLVYCMRPMELLCSGAPQKTVNDFLLALTATTRCFGRLTSLYLNSTSTVDYAMNGNFIPVGGRLLQQLLGGLGEVLDNLLAGLLGGTGPGGGLLGQVLGGGN